MLVLWLIALNCTLLLCGMLWMVTSRLRDQTSKVDRGFREICARLEAIINESNVRNRILGKHDDDDDDEFWKRRN